MKVRHHSVTDNSIWRRYRQQKTRGTEGFTLVELIVVLVVLGILASLAVMSLIGWQDYADFKQNNEAAKSLFTAAQIQLTQYGERGQLTALKNEITNDGKEKTGYLLKEAGIEDDSVWRPDTEGQISQKSDIYYLKAEKGDYAIYRNYLKGKTTKEMKDFIENSSEGSELGHKPTLVECRRIKALFDMLDPYIADKSILDAAISIEFSPDPRVAQVFSVFYNPKLKEFTYISTEAGNLTAFIGEAGRTSEKRREKQVGYYGAKVLSKGTDNNLRRPIINNVRLNNEDTLSLSWDVSLRDDKSTDVFKELFYSLDIYRAEDRIDGTDKTDGTKLGTITLGTGDEGLNVQSVEDGFYYVNATYAMVESRDPDGTEHWKKITDGTEDADNDQMSFPIKIDEANGTIKLILDAVDVSVDESAERKAVFHSASIERLKLDADNIFIYVSGMRPTVYETTKPKKSNTEHQYFGMFQTETVAAEENRACTILNTRQFNNIRYYEKKNPVFPGETTRIEYRVLSDLDWMITVNGGVVYQGARYPVVPETLESLSEEERSEVNFKPILKLGKNSLLTTTESGATHSMKNFQLKLTNVPAVAAGSEIPENTVGLFVLNQGAIENLVFEDVQVQGAEIGSYQMGASGAFCGVNQGTLTNLTVQSGTIAGDSHVGGILGAIDTSTDIGAGGVEIRLTGLLNRAEVTGNLYVGGIAGSLMAERQSITLKNCSNYGAVTGENRSTGDGERDSYYIGGIAGYAELAETAVPGRVDLRIESCTSSPSFEQDRIDEILKDIETSIKDDKESATLSGIYVGGILGLNRGATIEECDTLREDASEKGYVIGKKYVGGIVGFNEGRTGIVGGLAGRNQTQVIGQEFVGGIVGCNAKGTWEEGKREAVILSKEAANAMDGKAADEPENIYISNWVNEGAVMAVGDYAGGITGYNLGQIRGCNSDVDYSDEIRHLSQVTANARYAGGIAGYNAGLIDGKLTNTNNEVLAAVSVISGKDFVGGIAGYNDVSGVIKNYELRGGYIKGKRFVGGFIGLNADASVFETRVHSNPNEVAGDYFVGGIIGANLVPTNEDITARFRADNFLGSLRADKGAFAGGFIGYNYLLKAGTDASVVRDAVERLCENNTFPEIQETDDLEKISGSLQNVEQPLEQLLSGYENTFNKLTITGDEFDDAALDTQARLGNIRALVYVGGVIGYNQETTVLEIKNVENISLVEATAYIGREVSGTVRDLDGKMHEITIEPSLRGRQKRYSYAGGIIGRVAQNVTLDNCKNRDVGEVRSKGTYTGGLAELNEGRIRNCTAGSLGDGTQDYIGGLAGVNLGIVENCSVAGTIMGQSRIGGLVSENYGQIINPSVGSGADGCYIETTGQDAGGVAGYGFEGSSVTWDKGTTININVNGDGNRVGGVIGTNEGTVTVTMAGGATDQVIENLEKNSIIGRSYVGGFIGVQKGKASLAYMHNYAEVQAEQGFAGGIVSWISAANSKTADEAAKESVIKLCQNFGAVSVLTEGGDGDEGDTDLFPGVPGEEENNEDIDEVDDDLFISAAGGITAVNFGTITECVDSGIVDGGNGYSGGIAGLNYGKILYSRVGGGGSRDVLALSGDSYVGGITAKNKPGAAIENSAVLRLELQNQTFTAVGYMGGVTGENLGQIKNCSVGVDWEPEQKKDGKNEYADWHEAATKAVMQAVHTAKAGTVDKNYTLEDDDNAVVLKSNSPDVSMGGVAGINRYPEEAGKSDTNGRITGISQGKDKDSIYTVVLADLKFPENSMSYYGNMGGIAGVNQGTIEHYEFNGFIHGTANDPSNTPEYSPSYDYEQSGSTIYGYGGIAGVNGDDRAKDDAKIKNCLVNMARVNGIGSATNRTNVGGVAGVNGTGAEISHILFGNYDDLTGIYTGENPFFTSTINGVPYQGNVWVGTDDGAGVGHVGGVAGYNQGSVSYVNDWKNYEENRDRYFTEKGFINIDEAPLDEFKETETDYSAVIVHSTGHTGGVVGFNRRTGLIRDAVTGRKWVVGASKQEQDNGTGGIIGYNISDQNLEYCDNHATVVKMVGNSVGGIIGRNETATSSSWRIYNCRNYGTVLANARGGGILGQLKYKGGTFENCINYGTVQANGDACGGIVSMMYGLNLSEVVNFVDCKNFGDIGSTGNNISTGGILGQIANASDTNRTTNFYNCVNTGLIGGNGSNGSGGIVGWARSMNTNFYYCRNYGYSMNGANNNFGGIYYSGTKIKMTECFGVTDREAVGRPISSDVTASVPGGYYFADAGSVSDRFYVKKIKAEAAGRNLKTENNIGYVIAKESAPSVSGNTYFVKPQAGNPGFYSLEFNQPVNLDSISLTWNWNATEPSNAGFRFYKYSVVLYDENGIELDTIEIDEKSEYEDEMKAPDGVLRFDGGLENVSGIEIKDIVSVSGAGAAVNGALVKFSAKAIFESSETPVACTTFGFEDKKTTVQPGRSAEYEISEDRISSSVTDKQEEDKKYGIPLYMSKQGDVYMATSLNTQTKIETLGADNSLEKLLLRDHIGERNRDSLLAYGVYLNADKYLVLSKGDVTLSPPVIGEKKPMGGYYRIPWTGDAQAQYYNVEYVYFAKNADGSKRELGEKDSSGNVIWNRYTVYTNAIDILSDYSFDGVRADGVMLRVQAGARLADGQTTETDMTVETSFEFGVTLPTPLVHWELVTLNKNQCYRIVLDNKNDYEELAKTHPELDLSQIKISTWLMMGAAQVGGSQRTFTVEDGALLDASGNYELLPGYDISNRYLVAFADTDLTGYDRSAESIREAELPSRDQYANGNGTSGLMANAVLETSGVTGFFGDTMTSLYYQTSLTAVGEWVVNYRTELVATKNDLGIPVAYAVSPFTRTSPSGTTTSKIVLNGIPNDFLNKVSADTDGSYVYDKVQIRMYPSKMSNDIFYQGWQVKLTNENGTATLDELAALHVSEDGQIGSDGDPLLVKEKNGKKSVQPGYVIEYAGNDRYTLYYNTLLREMVNASDDGEKNDPNWKYQTSSQTDTYRYSQVFYHPVDLKKELEGKGIQPEPKAYVNAQAVKDSAGNVTWADGNYQTSDTFTLTWDQKAVDGDTPAYGTAENQYKIGAKYLLSVDGISYQKAADGTDTGTEQSTPLATNVSIETVDEAVYNTWTAKSENWAYDSIRVTLTRLGETGLSGITNKFPATYTNEYKLKKRLATIGKPTIANKAVGGEIQKDGLEYVISWTGIDKMSLDGDEKARQQDAFRCYEVVVTGQTSGTAYTGHTPDHDITEASLLLDFANPVTTDAGDKYFYQGEKVSITVTALTREDKDTYRDGITSAVLDMEIPIRLEAPDMGKDGDASPNMTAVVNTPVSVTEFEKGCITLHMKRSSGVKYQIALQVFENEADAGTGNNPVEEIQNLPEKSNEKRSYMSEQADDAIYTVAGIPAKYAGKWLKVVLRAVSDSDISSLWTDEDTDLTYFDGTSIKTHTKVEPYRLFQLPAVQVEPVKLGESVSTETLEYELLRDGKPGSGYRVAAVQNVVTFTTVDYADDYQINIIQTPQTAARTASPSDAEMQMVASDVIQMRVVLSDDRNSYNIEYQSSELPMEVSATGNDTTIEIVEIPLEIDKDAVILPYEKTIPIVETDDGSYTLNMEASLKADRDEKTGQIVFTLVLPDAKTIEELSGGDIELPKDAKLDYTEQVLIQSLANENTGTGTAGNQIYYDSDWAAVARVSDLLTVIPDAIPLPKMAADGTDEPGKGTGIDGWQVDESTHTGFAYELSSDFNGTTRYLVRVTDEDDNLLGIYGVPYNTRLSTSVFTSNVWFPVELAADAERTVKLNFASIFSLKKGSDGKFKGGLSAFSEKSYELTLPPVTPASTIALVQYTSSPIVCETTVSGRTRSVVTRKVTAKQRQIEWNYSYDDSKVTGYELTVQGGNMAADYNLELDLTRNEFGSFAGLEEYMTPEGKVLYSVAYDLDGDMIPFTTDVPTASASDAEPPTATGSNATPSNSTMRRIPTLATSSVMDQAGILILNCSLRVEPRKDGLKFILTLPDAAIGQLKGNAAKQYQSSEYYYDGGLYNTERISVQPLVVNPYYELPEPEWIAILHSYREDEEGSALEEDSEDGELYNNLN